MHPVLWRLGLPLAYDPKTFLLAGRAFVAPLVAMAAREWANGAEGMVYH